MTTERNVVRTLSDSCNLEDVHTSGQKAKKIEQVRS